MNQIFVGIKRHWLLWAIAALAALVLAGAGYLGYRANRAQGTAAVAAPPTVAVSRGDVVLSVTAPGLSISTNTQSISSRVSGRVAQLLVQPGDAVGQDQLLMRLGDREN